MQQIATTSATLPLGLRPKSCDLVRLGRAGDGGYLLCKNDLLNANALISMGINTDWSFEKAVLELKDVLIHAYDGSVSSAKLWRLFFKKIGHPFPPRTVIERFKAAWQFPKFFGPKATHFEEYVGSDTLYPNVNIATVISRLPSDKEKIFFKIDIEGSEWAILDELIAVAGRTTGLVIEFHDCDRNLQTIVDFVASYPLNLVHIHANNWADVAESGVPQVLELSFSSSLSGPDFGAVPHPLEQKNRLSGPDIQISFQ